ncbi:TPA: hypothetical protein EYP70_07285, partial [Candidatus Bathyarchaeota archaeon]|nr:hypothetical protein [Candidatus Bathyarchaeota archaeon]
MFRRRAESWERLLRLIERFRERGAISLNRAVTIEDLGLPPRFKDAVNSPLVDILSAEVGRFLHRATSRLEGT